MSPTISIEINMISTDKADCQAMTLFNALEEQRSFVQGEFKNCLSEGKKQEAGYYETELTHIESLHNELFRAVLRYGQENHFLAFPPKGYESLSYDEYLAKRESEQSA